MKAQVRPRVEALAPESVCSCPRSFLCQLLLCVTLSAWTRRPGATMLPIFECYYVSLYSPNIPKPLRDSPAVFTSDMCRTDSRRGSVCLFLCLPVNNSSVWAQVIGFVSVRVFNKEESCCCVYIYIQWIGSNYSITDIGILILYISQNRLFGWTVRNVTWPELSGKLCDWSASLQTCLVFDSGLFLMIKAGL